MSLFEKKVKFLIDNNAKPWVHKEHAIPMSIVGVMNSIGRFPSFKSSGLLRTIRCGLMNAVVVGQEIDMQARKGVKHREWN
jgi:hypothetical protein